MVTSMQQQEGEAEESLACLCNPHTQQTDTCIPSPRERANRATDRLPLVLVYTSRQVKGRKVDEPLAGEGATPMVTSSACLRHCSSKCTPGTNSAAHHEKRLPPCKKARKTWQFHKASFLKDIPSRASTPLSLLQHDRWSLYCKSTV